MATLLTTIGSIITAVVDWCGDIVTMVTSAGNELLLLFLVVPLIGLGIGFLKRIMNG